MLRNVFLRNSHLKRQRSSLFFNLLYILYCFGSQFLSLLNFFNLLLSKISFLFRNILSFLFVRLGHISDLEGVIADDISLANRCPETVYVASLALFEGRVHEVVAVGEILCDFALI